MRDWVMVCLDIVKNFSNLRYNVDPSVELGNDSDLNLPIFPSVLPSKGVGWQ